MKILPKFRAAARRRLHRMLRKIATAASDMRIAVYNFRTGLTPTRQRRRAAQRRARLG